jgi:hypothetical protein
MDSFLQIFGCFVINRFGTMVFFSTGGFLCFFREFNGPGKKVKNWLKETDLIQGLTEKTEAHSNPRRPSAVATRAVLSPRTPSTRHDAKVLAPVAKEKTSKPRPPRAACDAGKLKNGLKRPVSKNVILGCTYPFSPNSDDSWRAKTQRAAELRAAASPSNLVLQKRPATSPVKLPGTSSSPQPLMLFTNVNANSLFDEAIRLVKGKSKRVWQCTVIFFLLKSEYL